MAGPLLISTRDGTPLWVCTPNGRVVTVPKEVQGFARRTAKRGLYLVSLLRAIHRRSTESVSGSLTRDEFRDAVRLFVKSTQVHVISHNSLTLSGMWGGLAGSVAGMRIATMVANESPKAGGWFIVGGIFGGIAVGMAFNLAWNVIRNAVENHRIIQDAAAVRMPLKLTVEAVFGREREPVEAKYDGTTTVVVTSQAQAVA